MNAAAKMIHQSNLFTGQFADIRISKQSLLKMILALFVFFSALAVIYVTNMYRITFDNLQKAEENAHHLQLQWGQLLLEQASLASPARVQKLAIEKLDMTYPSNKQVIRLPTQ